MTTRDLETAAEPKGREVLVVSRDSARGKAFAVDLDAHRGGSHAVHVIDPEGLRDATKWLDAVGALVYVGREEASRDLALLSGLRERACATRLILILDPDLDSLEAEACVALLEPALVLDDRPSRRSLGSAFDRVLPAVVPAAGRENHRTVPGLLGVSRAIRDVTRQVRQIAESRIPVLILGETGTGKEVVARALHHESKRAAKPFVAINCGAFPEALLESELFGSMRGAFTGATRDREGVFEQASGGTLFLDEIGEMPAAMQVKLLRVLEEGEIRRIGDHGTRKIDVRVVSATHRDLETETSEGRFRQDLLFRLNTSSIQLPPLRRRAVDIPFLAQHFAEEFGRENAREITLSEDFLEALCQHEFPGNVRELRNAVERAIALASPSDRVVREHLPKSFESNTAWPQTGSLKERLEQLETHVISETLDRFDGNRTHTAAELGLSRAGLRKKLVRLGLD